MIPRLPWVRSRRAAVLFVIALAAITGGVATAATLLLTAKTLTTGTQSVSVPLFQPTLTASAVPTAASAGASLSNVTTLSGGTTALTGNITYRLYGPGNVTCTGAPVASPSVAATGNASYTASPAPAPTAVGTYQWSVSYAGDTKNSPAPNPASCGNGGSVVLTSAASTLSITRANPSSNKATFTGTGGVNGATVTVYVCTAGTCSSTNNIPTLTTTATVSNGTWTTTATSVNVNDSTSRRAFAYQTSPSDDTLTSAAFTFRCTGNGSGETCSSP